MDVGAFLLRFLTEFRGSEQRSAVNSVASRFRSGVDHWIADAARSGKKQFFAPRDA